MELFRIAQHKFSKTLSGKGAAVKGARWNSQGIEVIYLAENRSLAMAEVAVSLSFADIPDNFMMLTIYVPPAISVQHLNAKFLPDDWNIFPHSKSTQKIGNKFILENKCCLLRVPSAVTKGDFNFLINPAHKEFKKIKIISAEKFPFDSRIFR